MLRFLPLVLGAWRRFRFRLWVLELRLRLRLAGSRLELDAPHGARLESRPTVKAYPMGEGGGVLRIEIGRDVEIGDLVVIELDAHSDNRLAIGTRGLIQNSVRLVIRGGTIEIGEFTSVQDGAWLKTSGMLKLGDNVQVSQYDILHCEERLELADWVGLAERVTVLDSDHGFDGTDTHFRDQPLLVEPTTIDRNTFVAAGAVILRGARIGRNCLVAANAVVRGGDYPDGSMIAGIPGKVVTTRGEDD